MSPLCATLLLAVALLAGASGQLIDPDAEVFNVDGGETVVVNQPQPTLPEINVNTSNEINNNIPAPQIIQIPAQPQVAPAPVVVNPTPVVVNPAPQVVNPAPQVVNPTPAVVNPTPAVVNPTAGVVGTGYGVGFVPLGSLLMGGLGVGGVGAGGLANLMRPRMIIGR